MTWNYRLIYHHHEPWYAIHEVYYDEDSQPVAISETPDAVVGESKTEISDVLNLMQQAVQKPCLRADYFDELENRQER